MNDLQATIDRAWDDRATLSPASAPSGVKEAVAHVIGELDAGRLRVAEKVAGVWTTHQWIKKAVLLSFRLSDNVAMGPPPERAPFRFYDKVSTKFARFDDAAFAQAGVRVVPPAVARRGAFIAKGVVLMPSYVNIGA
jgi:2,3,4,5-tetrahydropyridine-2-carboxylate N-succinyltransferase